MHFEKVRGGQSQSKQKNRVLVRYALESKPQKAVCDAVLSECESTRPLNPRTQPVPGAILRQDLFQRYHSERTLAERSVDGPEI